jgi:hypothetical protein
MSSSPRGTAVRVPSAAPLPVSTAVEYWNSSASKPAVYVMAVRKCQVGSLEVIPPLVESNYRAQPCQDTGSEVSLVLSPETAQPVEWHVMAKSLRCGISGSYSGD